MATTLTAVGVTQIRDTEEANIGTPKAGFVLPFFRANGQLCAKLADGSIVEVQGGGGGGSTALYELPTDAEDGSLLIFGRLDGQPGWYPFAAPSGPARYVLTCEDAVYTWVSDIYLSDPSQGSAVPEPPTQGNFLLRSVNGAMAWVAEAGYLGGGGGTPTPQYTYADTPAKLTGTITASSSYGQGYDAEKMWDGDPSTRGLTAANQATAWVRLDTELPAGAILTSVRVYPSPGSDGLPRSGGLAVETSEDGNTWRTATYTAQAQDNTWKETLTPSLDPTRYIRVSRDDGDVIDLREIEFWGRARLAQ